MMTVAVIKLMIISMNYPFVCVTTIVYIVAYATHSYRAWFRKRSIIKLPNKEV